MFNQNILNSAIILTGTIPLLDNYLEYGFGVILIVVLFLYSRSSYKDNIRREKQAEVEKKELIDRYESRLKASEQRYHDLHIEIMTYLINKK